LSLNFLLLLFDFVISHFQINCKCRYLLSAILLWSLNKQVDLIPPSNKHMQFDRFAKNGKGLLCLYIRNGFVIDFLAEIYFQGILSKQIVQCYFRFIHKFGTSNLSQKFSPCYSFFVQIGSSIGCPSRFIIVLQVFYYTGCTISCTPRSNIRGCISSLFEGLVGSVPSRGWSSCCRAGEI